MELQGESSSWYGGPLFPQGAAFIMVRTVGYSVFFVLLALCAVQFVNMACFDDCLRQWSTDPVHAHDQLPGSPDGQTESDQGEGELEELALAQGVGLRVIDLAQTCVPDHVRCPRTHFTSDWFRPPAHS